MVKIKIKKVHLFKTSLNSTYVVHMTDYAGSRDLKNNLCASYWTPNKWSILYRDIYRFDPGPLVENLWDMLSVWSCDLCDLVICVILWSVWFCDLCDLVICVIINDSVRVSTTLNRDLKRRVWSHFRTGVV